MIPQNKPTLFSLSMPVMEGNMATENLGDRTKAMAFNNTN